ncbi:MAG: DUF748 domain-containing protein, partial [Phycisphaerales bacterium JB038]
MSLVDLPTHLRPHADQPNQLPMNAEPTPPTTDASSQAENAKPTGARRRWRRRLALTLIVLVLLYTLFGFFGVPLLIKKVGLSRLQEQLTGQATLGGASFNPYTFDLVLRDFQVIDEAGERVFGFERFDGNFQLWATTFQAGFHFLEAEVTRPFLHAELAADGSLNLAELFKSAPEPEEEKEPLKRIPHVVVKKMGAVDADLAFFDFTAPEPFEFALTSLTCRLDGLDTDPEKANPLRLDAMTPDGRTLTWEGTINIDPLSSRGSLTIGQAYLPRFMPYALHYTDVRLTDGRLTLSLDYEFAPVALPRVAQVELQELLLEQLKGEHERHGVFEIAQVKVRSIDADADARTVSIEHIGIVEPSIHLLRDREGRIELLTVIDRPAVEETVEEILEFGEHSQAERIDPRSIEYPIPQVITAVTQLAEDALGGWEIAIAEFAVERAAGSWTDESPRRGVEIGYSDLSLVAGPIRSSEGFSVPFELSGTIADEGRLACSGTAGVLAQQFTLHVDLSSLPLAPVAPYLPQAFVADLPPADLARATLGVTGDAEATIAETGAIEAIWNGVVSLTEVAVVAAE